MTDLNFFALAAGPLWSDEPRAQWNKGFCLAPIQFVAKQKYGMPVRHYDATIDE